MYKSIPFLPTGKLRNRLKFLLILFLVAEIAVFIAVVSAVGIFITLGLVILSSVLGSKLLRTHFLNLRKQQQQTGISPSSSVKISLENTMIVFAAFLLIIPGFITDMVAIVLLIPQVRRLLTPWLTKKEAVATARKEKNGDIIEGEYWRNDK